MRRNKLASFAIRVSFLFVLLLLLTRTSMQAEDTPWQLVTNREWINSYRQCPDAPFAIPAEYVHASFSESAAWPHVGVDFTGRTTDINKARQPLELACPEDGAWDLGLPGEAPVYAAYDGVVWGSHIVGGTWVGLYIKHENVPVDGHIEPVVCTYYEHMANDSTGESTIFPEFRQIGAAVEKGEQIGWIGNFPETFAHLHFGVRPSLYNGWCNPGSNPPPLDPYWWTDPSPFLGYNVNYDNGAPQYCYSVDCPNLCCCSTFAMSGEYEASEDDMELPHFASTEPSEVISPSNTVSDIGIVPIQPPTRTLIPERVQREPVEPQRVPPASANYRIPKSVFATSGGAKISTHYAMNGTQGQTTSLERRQSANYVLRPGYWDQIGPRYQIYIPLVLKSF